MQQSVFRLSDSRLQRSIREDSVPDLCFQHALADLLMDYCALWLCLDLPQCCLVLAMVSVAFSKLLMGQKKS